MMHFTPSSDALAAPSDAHHDFAIERLIAAATSGPPTQTQKDRATALRDAAVLFGAAIEAYVPAGRDKSIAWTHLEDTLMRATRGIYSTGTEQDHDREEA